MKIKEYKVGYLKKDIRKKTSHCTPKEITERIAEIIDSKAMHNDNKYPLIEDIMNEWRYS